VASAMSTIDEASSLICDLCDAFYKQGWVSGTGGGISIKTPAGIVVAPSGVQKERMLPADMFVLDEDGEVSRCGARRPGSLRPPKLSECTPLFMAAYKLRGAGAVIHSHSMHAMLATLIDEESTEFSVTQLEMIKGIAGHGYYDNCVVPIIENTARECELTDSLSEAIKQYPKANAVLVRRHGVYIWGDSWIQAKTQAECYHYLFEAAVAMRHMGARVKEVPKGAADNGCTAANGRPTKRARLDSNHQPLKAVVLDIEGTVSPLSFVADVMFPYAMKNVQQYLTQSYATDETERDVQAIRKQAAEDKLSGASNIVIPPATETPEAVISACCQWARSASEANRKVAALKNLQGHIWRKGFSSGELVAQLFPDVLPMLKAWKDRGVKVYIYSSGSREAQRLFFAHTQVGNIHDYTLGFFDTKVGPKFEPRSYEDIALTVGVEDPRQILFAADVLREAQAASTAGWRAVLVDRPGNAPITAKHSFEVVTSLAEIKD